MKYCPITYEMISDHETYSKRGLHLLSPGLKNLKPLDYSAYEQREKALELAGKMSIQGIQKKLSAQLKVKDEHFEIVDRYGHYILKPQSDLYKELPQNEALTMTLAKLCGLQVPIHGLVYSKDGSMTYFVKRFDRAGHNQKLATEDFAQLSGLERGTKYESSMEKVAQVIVDFCTFPKIELAKLFKLTLFNFLIGNEDMHVKNFSLITRDKITTLSPAYDLLNSTIAMPQVNEELALPLNGRKRNLRRKDFFEYFANDRLQLNAVIIDKIVSELKKALPVWESYIEISFLSPAMKEKYLNLLEERCNTLEITH